jgi:hypothetical protein
MNRIPVAIGLAFIILLSPILLTGQTSPAEAFPSSSVTNNEKAYQIKIERIPKNALEEKLLQIAETTEPEPSEIEKVCPSPRNTNQPLQSPDLPRWWCGSFDGIFVPYAITKNAVAYYLAVTDDFRQGNFDRSGKLKMKSSSLHYSASVDLRPSYTNGEKRLKDVYEVTMALSWSQYCGSLCAMGFSKKRTVILDKEGKVLMILGDEQPGIIVS